MELMACVHNKVYSNDFEQKRTRLPSCHFVKVHTPHTAERAENTVQHLAKCLNRIRSSWMPFCRYHLGGGGEGEGAVKPPPLPKKSRIIEKNPTAENCKIFGCDLFSFIHNEFFIFLD